MELIAELGHLFLQIGRVICFIILGLFAANIIESLNWGERVAVIARPLIQLGRLSTFSGAAFSVAFFSGVAANTMLAEAYSKRKIAKKELVLANLFNSLPRFFLHLPTVFFLTTPFLHSGAFIYVGLSFCAALLQSCVVLCAGQIFLKKKDQSSKADEPSPATQKKAHTHTTFLQAVKQSGHCLPEKLIRIVKFMLPVYLLFFVAEKFGFFAGLNGFLAEHAWFLNWLKPEALGIVVLHITVEFSAGLTAASALLTDSSLCMKEVVLALLAGNVLAAPIRAIRHQFPYYSGIYSPKLAMELVAISQGSRILSIILIAALYYFL